MLSVKISRLLRRLGAGAALLLLPLLLGGFTVANQTAASSSWDASYWNNRDAFRDASFAASGK